MPYNISYAERPGANLCYMEIADALDPLSDTIGGMALCGLNSWIWLPYDLKCEDLFKTISSNTVSSVYMPIHYLPHTFQYISFRIYADMLSSVYIPYPYLSCILYMGVSVVTLPILLPVCLFSSLYIYMSIYTYE